MPRFAIVRNERTTLYEIHRDGCRHLIAAHLDRVATVSAPSGRAAAADYEARNDGLVTRLGPCAKA